MAGKLKIQHRDLRTGRTVWQARGRPSVPKSALWSTLDADVLVVGAGISGALTAYLLAQAGLRVVIVDRRGLVCGSTVASTALLQFEIDTPLTKLIGLIGRDAAERAWRRSAQSVQDLGRLVERAAIACSWAPREALYLAGNSLNADGLAAECAARRRIGLPSEMIGRAALRKEYGIDRAAAIRSGGAAEVDPVRLAAGFIQHAVARGARFLAPLEIASVTASARGIAARTKSGPVLRASHMVYATGYEIPRRVPARGHRLISTWAIATAPQPDRLWRSRCLIWEASDPYLYVRTTLDGRVIAGGEDQPIDDEEERDALIEAKSSALQKKLRALLPHLDATPDFAWAGTFGESDTGLPSIGRVPGMPRCYAILGYGGNGITFSMIAAQMICGYIRGPRDPDCDLFSFEAKRRQALKA